MPAPSDKAMGNPEGQTGVLLNCAGQSKKLADDIAGDTTTMKVNW
jgi:hypothetical protein